MSACIIQLYRICDDPLEIHNRYGEPACNEIALDLFHELAIWMMRSQDPLPLPTQYGYKRDARNYMAPYSTQS
jgi:hypothetical protein